MIHHHRPPLVCGVRTVQMLLRRYLRGEVEGEGEGGSVMDGRRVRKREVGRTVVRIELRAASLL